MTVADTIAKIRARRITASSITQGELLELVEAAEGAASYLRQRDEAGEREKRAAMALVDAGLRVPQPCTTDPRGYCDRGAERRCEPGSCAHREVARPVARPVDLAAFFDAKAAWARGTFGDHLTPSAILGHLRKELDEIERDPADLVEWVDLVLLAIDGAHRFAGADGRAFVAALLAKHAANTRREWPPIGSIDPTRPVEHVRGDERAVTR
jgi:hypothetical protein